jgi:hypothetical protein
MAAHLQRPAGAYRRLMAEVAGHGDRCAAAACAATVLPQRLQHMLCGPKRLLLPNPAAVPCRGVTTDARWNSICSDSERKTTYVTLPAQAGLWGWGRARAAPDMIWAVPRGLDPAHACRYRPREADWRTLKPSYIFSHMSIHFRCY